MDKKKAILVIDMPESCAECDLMWEDEYSVFCPCRHPNNTADIYDHVQSQTKPDWCPLKPVPEKEDVWDDEEIFGWYDRGWNACVDKILGG